MMQDPRTSKQALAGLFDTDMLMSDEFSRKKQPQEQKPMSIIDQMDERHGKFSNRLSLFGHLLSGGTRADFGDADLLAAQKASQAQQAVQDKMGMMQPFVDMLQDGNPDTNAMAMFGISQLGGDAAEMFPNLAGNKTAEYYAGDLIYDDETNR